MPIVVRATGPEPASQEEIEERRRARLAKTISKSSKKKKRPSATAGMSNVEKLFSGVERKLIKFVLAPDAAVTAAGWADARPGIHVVLPGAKGHRAYIYQIKERLKEAGFQWNPDVKLWWREAPHGVHNQSFE